MATATTEQNMNGTAQLPATHRPAQVPTAIGDQLGILGALVDSQAWNRLVKMAEVFSNSTIVPEHFRNNVGNCIIGLQMSMRLKCDPFMLMQHLYVVHGKPGFEAKFAIALANERQAFRGPIRFEMHGTGKERSCTAWAIDRETGERVEETVSMKIAQAEGWIDKKGSKWLTMPDMMLKYRAAAWLIRTTCPEVLMGMQTTDELHDAEPVRIAEPLTTSNIVPRAGQSVSAALAEKLRPLKPVEAEIVPEPQQEEPETAAPFDATNAMSYDAIQTAIKGATSLEELQQLMDEISMSMAAGEITADGATKLGNLVEMAAAPLKKK